MATPERFADQISKAVQNAISSQDFSQLQSTIERSVDGAARSIGRGFAQVQDAYRQAQQAQLEEQQRREIEKRELAIYGKHAGEQVKGVALISGGAFVLVPSVPSVFLALASGSIAALIGTLLFAGVGAGLLVAGIGTITLVNRFLRFRKRIGLREYCTVEELSLAESDSPNNIVKDLKRMISKGLFLQAGMDRQESQVIMTREAYAQYQLAEQRYQARLREESKAASVASESTSDKGLSSEAAELLSRGEAYVARIRLSNEAIPGEEISRKIDQIENVVRMILKRAMEHPEVIDDLGQLMDYYLPTTVKLLDAYRDLDAQPIQGENIVKSKREIEGALDSLAIAFEKLLDSIFRDMAWDVSSDISVLHTVLAQEGLVKDPFVPRE